MGAPNALLVATLLALACTIVGSDLSDDVDVYGDSSYSHYSSSRSYSSSSLYSGYESSSESETEDPKMHSPSGELSASQFPEPEDDLAEASLIAPSSPDLKALRNAVFTSDLSRDDARTNTVSCGVDSSQSYTLSSRGSDDESGDSDSTHESIDVYENSIRDRVLLARDRVSESDSDSEDILVQSMSTESSSLSVSSEATPLDDTGLSSHFADVNNEIRTEVFPEKWRAYATIRLFPGTLRVLSTVSKKVLSFSDSLDETKVFSKKEESTSDLYMRDSHKRWPLRSVRRRRVVVHFPKRRVLVYKTKEVSQVYGKSLGKGDLKYSIPFDHIVNVRNTPDTHRSKDCLVMEFVLPHGMKHLHNDEGDTDYVRFCLPPNKSATRDSVSEFIGMIQDMLVLDKNVRFLSDLQEGLGTGLLSWYEKKFDEPMIIELDHEMGIMEKGPTMCTTDIRQLGRAPRNVVIPGTDYQASPHIQMAMEQCEGMSAFNHCDLETKKLRSTESLCSCSCTVYHKDDFPKAGFVSDWVYKTCTGAKLSYFGRLKADSRGQGEVNVPTAMIMSTKEGDNIVPFLFVKYYNWKNIAYRGQSIVPEELSGVPNTSYTTMNVNQVRKEIEEKILFVKALSGGTTGGRWPSAYMVKTALGNDYVIKFQGNRKLLSALGHLLGMATPRLCSTKISVDKVMKVLRKISVSGCMEGRSDAYTLYSKFDSARRFGDTELESVSIDVQDLAFGRQRMEIPHMFSVLTSAEQAGMIAAFDMLTVRTDLFNIIDEESANNIIGYDSIIHGGASRDSVVNIDMNIHTSYENFEVKNKPTPFTDRNRHYRASLHELLYSVYSHPDKLVPFVDLNMGVNFHHTSFLPAIRDRYKKGYEHVFTEGQIRRYKLGLLIQLGIVEFAINLLESEKTVLAVVEKEGDSNTLEYFKKRIDRDFKFAYGGIETNYDSYASRPIPDDPSAAEDNPLEGWHRARRVLVDLICAEGFIETDQLKDLRTGKPWSEVY